MGSESAAMQSGLMSLKVGTEGILGGQAFIPGVQGEWKSSINNVNLMAMNLTKQVRSIAELTKAVASGDMTKKIVDVKGEIAVLKETANEMTESLSVFAVEVPRVAREVGTEGKLGGQARVANVAGTWKALTDNVNIVANNLTLQVRMIAVATTAVAWGDLTQKIAGVFVSGEMLNLVNTINDMIDQLLIPVAEVKKVAREVGTEGKPQRLIGDSLRLRQVITNLVGNAIKFTLSKVTRKGHVALSCRLLAGDDQSVTLEFCVLDSGIGIAKDKSNLIFDTFRQADGVRRGNTEPRHRSWSLRITELGLKPFVVHEVGTLVDKEQCPHIDTIVVDSLAVGNVHPHCPPCTFNAALNLKWCLDNFITSQVTTPVTAQDLSSALVSALESSTVSPVSAPNDVMYDILLAEVNLVNQKLAVKILEK
ncbi:histidine kinase osmosensor [Marasmius tenuissimus]|uniref:Histidine kinase osmosensor n=1 Tax=Marasmius tenuissimus TaxID=585030 RepID=A0ABR2Z7C5_9AGAR